MRKIDKFVEGLIVVKIMYTPLKGVLILGEFFSDWFDSISGSSLLKWKRCIIQVGNVITFENNFGSDRSYDS